MTFPSEKLRQSRMRNWHLAQLRGMYTTVVKISQANPVLNPARLLYEIDAAIMLLDGESEAVRRDSKELQSVNTP